MRSRPPGRSRAKSLASDGRGCEPTGLYFLSVECRAMPLSQDVLDAEQRMKDAAAALRAYVDSGESDREKHRRLLNTLEITMQVYLRTVHRLANRRPCACGCGKYPKRASSRFLPGHDLKKAYRGIGKLK